MGFPQYIHKSGSGPGLATLEEANTQMLFSGYRRGEEKRLHLSQVCERKRGGVWSIWSEVWGEDSEFNHSSLNVANKRNETDYSLLKFWFDGVEKVGIKWARA